MQSDRPPRRAVARPNGTDTPLMLITSKGFRTECVITDDAKNKAGICIHVSFNDVSFLAGATTPPLKTNQYIFLFFSS